MRQTLQDGIDTFAQPNVFFSLNYITDWVGPVVEDVTLAFVWFAGGIEFGRWLPRVLLSPVKIIDTPVDNCPVQIVSKVLNFFNTAKCRHEGILENVFSVGVIPQIAPHYGKGTTFAARHESLERRQVPKLGFTKQNRITFCIQFAKQLFGVHDVILREVVNVIDASQHQTDRNQVAGSNAFGQAAELLGLKDSFH